MHTQAEWCFACSRAHTRKMVPSLGAGQTCARQSASSFFHTKALNVPALLFSKVPPASCVPHTDLVSVLCWSPVLSRRKPSTIPTCNVPAYPISSITPLSFCALYPPPPGRGLLTLKPGKMGLLLFVVISGTRFPALLPGLQCKKHGENHRGQSRTGGLIFTHSAN